MPLPDDQKPDDQKPDDQKLRRLVELQVTDQVFTFTDATGTQWHWNASKGYRLIEQAPREPMAFYPAGSGIELLHLKKRYPTLDEEYAKTVDLSRPILFVPFHDGTSVLADGWHRMARALMEGIPFLLCYQLTPEEAEQVLLLKIPPRKGQQNP